MRLPAASSLLNNLRMKLLESLSVGVGKGFVEELVKERQGGDFSSPRPFACRIGPQDQRTFFPTGNGALQLAIRDDFYAINDGAHSAFLARKADVMRRTDRNLTEFDHCGCLANAAMKMDEQFFACLNELEV